ncbi:uncharacterized protein PHACADRAFT_201897 [Phanerochaete carnosa HHB-10118-sp]|uniref:Uncharacterized protein n=1 Tax=Phanerochaete carnosa (strain HHB-10118-sp) TaxID=650164 RepID=K5VRK1_PHACS|nr:uncharacterized protein PHACADRAFT_201897 [Phanerochaete carnosa HHB-10118-sp]EKM49214.1 hypothetical protein PHACADRAFT_201897 [Phanerochaete carnosa HHB-10118-sp]
MPPRNHRKKRAAETPQKTSKRQKVASKHVEFDNGAVMTQFRLSGEFSSEGAVQGSPAKKRGGRKGPGVQDVAEEEVLMAFVSPRRGRANHQYDPSGESSIDKSVPVADSREYINIDIADNSEDSPTSPMPAAGSLHDLLPAPAIPTRKPAGPPIHLLPVSVRNRLMGLQAIDKASKLRMSGPS